MKCTQEVGPSDTCDCDKDTRESVIQIERVGPLSISLGWHSVEYSEKVDSPWQARQLKF